MITFYSFKLCSVTPRTLASALGLSIISAVLLMNPLASTPAHGETLAMPHGGSTHQTERPRRGITKADVESRFGSPQSKHGPAGTPPIYFWEYPEYTVYFENNIVIHSVSKLKSLKAQ